MYHVRLIINEQGSFCAVMENWVLLLIILFQVEISYWCCNSLSNDFNLILLKNYFRLRKPFCTKETITKFNYGKNIYAIYAFYAYLIMEIA